ncbi:DUF2911 domain-containing protein [Flavobacteriaceae bacterium 3-367]|uniref:DUF2911 domain-containing protein n=1 Tax=Eudoraea algarum TaxID=3417568 RepID=UPI003275316E
MKKLVTLATFVFALVFSFETSAQEFSGLDKSPLDIAVYPASGRVPNKLVRVTYSRPQLKGRSLANLAPNGKVWRTGANEAVEVVFYKDAKVGGQAIKAGTYSMFTIPGESEWTVIFNSKLNQWGAYSYDESADVVRAKASASKDSSSLEAFSIAYKEVDGGVHMVLGWDTTRVALPISQ